MLFYHVCVVLIDSKTRGPMYRRTSCNTLFNSSENKKHLFWKFCFAI